MLLFVLVNFLSAAWSCPESALFTDHSLQEWMKGHKKSLILLVSDGMPYSEMSVVQVQKEALKRKLGLVILSDRSGKLQKERCDPLLASSQLFSRGALRHFPSLFFIKNHQLFPKMIPGIQSQKELEINLDEVFHE